MLSKTTSALVVTALLGAGAVAQNSRPSSPPGHAATQIGGEWKETNGRTRYEGGHWIEVAYSRPVLRGRQGIFGEGAEYGERVNAGAPVWRAGANVSTRLHTEVDLTFGDQRVPAGSYSLFIDLKGPKAWTLIVSSWEAQEQYDPNNKTALWGSYGYTPDKDVARVEMTVAHLEFSVDQLTYGFLDVTNEGGKLALWWDDVMATVAFEVAE